MSANRPPRSHNRPSRPGQPTGPNWKLIGGAVGAVVFVTLLAIFAVAASNDSEDASAAPEFGAVEVSSSALPVLPDAGPDPAAGLVGPTIRSERARWGSGDGRSWCAVSLRARWSRKWSSSTFH